MFDINCSSPTGSDGEKEGENRLTLIAASLNGKDLEVAYPWMKVAPGELITGTVELQSENYGKTDWVAPLAGTPSWGGHRASFWGIEDWIDIGTQTYQTAIDLRAPNEPGTFYIFFAWSFEKNYSNVMSLTNWEYPDGDVWDDGVDVADWNDTQAQQGIDEGRVYTRYLNKEGNYDLCYVPGTAVRIQVVEAR